MNFGNIFENVDFKNITDTLKNILSSNEITDQTKNNLYRMIFVAISLYCVSKSTINTFLLLFAINTFHRKMEELIAKIKETSEKIDESSKKIKELTEKIKIN